MIGTAPYPPDVAQPYYVKLGRASDAITRCAECQRLVTDKTLQKYSSCRCGCRKVKEIQILSAWEWVKIRVGLVDFPHRALFLKEFRGQR